MLKVESNTRRKIFHHGLARLGGFYANLNGRTMQQVCCHISMPIFDASANDNDDDDDDDDERDQ